MNKAGTQTFETEHLVVRKFEDNDAEQLYKNHLDDNMKKWFPNEVYADEEEAKEAIEFFNDCVENERLPFVLAVELKETGELIGDTGVSEVEGVPTEVEIGYQICDKYSGNGYATELAKAMTAFSFDRFAIETVYGRVIKGNAASGRVLEKAGYSFVKEESGAEDDPYGNGMLVYKAEKSRDRVTKEQYETLFLEMHPGYFDRDYVRRVPEDEPAFEMLLDLQEFDPDCYSKPLGDEVSFGYYQGDIGKLKDDVARVVPHWIDFFNENSRVFCAFADGKVASFCMIEDFGTHTVAGMKWKIGGPGCVGTLPEFRNRGIGLSMVKEVTKILKEESYDHSYIHYTYETDWYGKLGYKTFIKWNGKGFCE